MPSNLTIPLTSRPFLSWEGFNAIGQRAKIEGDAEHGFSYRFYDDELERWCAPKDLDEARWIIDGLLADCMAKQAEPAPDLEIARAIQDARERFWDEPPTMQPYIEATVKDLGLKGSIPAHLVEQVRRLAYGAAVLDGVAFPDTAKQAGVEK